MSRRTHVKLAPQDKIGERQYFAVPLKASL